MIWIEGDEEIWMKGIEELGKKILVENGVWLHPFWFYEKGLKSIPLSELAGDRLVKKIYRYDL